MSLVAHNSYRPSGLEWLEQVPAHWDSPKQLGSISSLKGRLGWQGLKAEEYLREGPYVVSSAHFSDFQIRWDECPRVSQQRYEADSNIQLSVGDVVLMKDGAAMGKLAFVDRLPGPACLNSHLLLFRPLVDGDVTFYVPKFAFYFMQTKLFQEHIRINGTGATFLGISQAAISRYKVAWPPTEEQQSIVEFLDRETGKIDALIAEQEKLLTLLAEKRQATISHAVTRGLNPNARFKRSGITWPEKVPAHWGVTHIKRLCALITDGAHVSPETDNGVFHFVSTKDIGRADIDFEGCLLTSEASYEYLVKTGCQPLVGDVLFSKDGTIGRTIVVRRDRKFVVASSLIIIRPNDRLLAPEFLDFLCKSKLVKQQVEGFVKGAGLPRLSIQNLLKVVGVFPPLAEQRQIADYLSVFVAQSEALEDMVLRAISALRERRSALVSAAVTGQIDVRGNVSWKATA